MLIDCPACATSYHVDPAEIEGGRTVICARCDTQWLAEGPTWAPRPTELPHMGPAVRTDRVAQRVTGTPPSSRRGRGPRVSRGMSLGLASLALVSLTIGARAKIAQVVPGTAAIYAAAGMQVDPIGLDFSDVHADRLAPSSPMVTISGEIRNIAGRRVPIPRLVFEVRDAAGHALVRWSERASAKLLARGHALAFASSPHQLPADSRSALVHFEPDQS